MSYAVDAHLNTAERLVQSVQTITSSNLDYNDRVSLFVRAINSPLSYKEACELADHIEKFGFVTITDEAPAYGQITLAPRDSDDKHPMKLSFMDSRVYADASSKLRQAGFEIHDAFWGHAICKTADAAVSDAKFWSGR